MEKKRFKCHIMVSIICILSMFFCYIPTMYAKDLPAKDYLTDIRVSNTEIKNGGEVTISAQWHDRSDEPIHGGDTLTINFPEGNGIKSNGFQSSGNLTMSDGTVVGTIDVLPDKAVLKFNNEINHYIGQSVHGTVNCSFRIWDKNVSDGKKQSVNIPITGNKSYNPTITIKGDSSSSTGIGHETVNYTKPWVKKTGVKSYTNGREAWEIDGSLGSLKNAIVTDNIGQGIKLIEKSIRVVIICGDTHYLTVQQFEDAGYGTVAINPNDKGFTVHFNLKSLNKLAEKYNQPGVGFNITYNTRTEEPITFTGPEYLNSAVVNGVDKDNQPLHKEVVATLKNFNASWSISGTKNTLHVQKLDSETMQPVGGAVITIYNQQNGKTIEGTTNSEGLVEFSNLDPGNYTLTETKAPKGYEINKQLYLFKVDKDYTVSGFKGTNGKYNMNPVVFDQKEHTSTTTSSTTPITKPSTTTSSKKTSTTKPSTTTSSKKTESTTKPSTTTSSKKTVSTTKPSKTSSKKTESTTKPSTTTSSKKTESTTKPSTTTSSKKTVSTTKPSTTTSSKKKTNNQVNSSNQGSTGGAYNITTTTSSHGGSVVNHNNDQGNKSSSDNHGWLPQTGHKKSIIPLTGLGLLLIAIAIAAIVYLRKRKER